MTVTSFRARNGSDGSSRGPSLALGVRMRCLNVIGSSCVLAAVCLARAEAPPSPRPMRSAHQAVHDGNRLLLGNNPTAALDAYGEAEKLQPDAREIAFVQGLAHYELGEYDQAREAFQKAAGSEEDDLAADARYSAGTCDHAEALSATQDPQRSLSKLESAMQQYHHVLSRRPDHAAARDANFKAASLWREIQQQLQQQQQQKQPSDQNEQNDEEKNDDQQPSQPKDQEQEQQQDQQQQQSNQQQNQEQQQRDTQQKQAQSSDEPKDKQPQPQQAEAQEQQQERVSREQAERQLREMMQALKDRKKLRREEAQRVPISKVDKDW